MHISLTVGVHLRPSAHPATHRRRDGGAAERAEQTGDAIATVQCQYLLSLPPKHRLKEPQNEWAPPEIVEILARKQGPHEKEAHTD